jgi:hypothetical protein
MGPFFNGVALLDFGWAPDGLFGLALSPDLTKAVGVGWNGVPATESTLREKPKTSFGHRVLSGLTPLPIHQRLLRGIRPSITIYHLALSRAQHLKHGFPECVSV